MNSEVKRFLMWMRTWLSIGGWVIVSWLIIMGFLHGGFLHLAFNRYNEMIIELITFPSILIFIIVMAIIEWRNKNDRE